MSLLSCIPTFLTGQDSNQDEIDDALYNQLEYLQEEVTKPLDVIEGEFDDQKDNLQLECRVSAIQKETVIILGKRPVVHRIFVEGEHSSNYGVGWILYNDIDNCLICAKPFNNRNLKRYCWACGNLVCHKCSPSAREVHGIKELGKKRVCNQCNYGQVGVQNFIRHIIRTNDLYVYDTAPSLQESFAFLIHMLLINIIFVVNDS
jgi:hypothetical protein